jgi:hypothetical protein
MINTYITHYDIETDWLSDVTITKTTKKNADGSKYRPLVTDLRLPINIREAAELCGDEGILEEVMKYHGLN